MTFRCENIPNLQTRLDRYVENKHIDILSPETVSFLFGFDGKVASNEILKWKERHSGAYFELDPAKPDIIKISLNDHDTELYNRFVHNKNNRRYKNAKAHRVTDKITGDSQ